MAFRRRSRHRYVYQSLRRPTSFRGYTFVRKFNDPLLFKVQRDIKNNQKKYTGMYSGLLLLSYPVEVKAGG